MKNDNSNSSNDGVAMTRRRMLMRLGLAATAIYAAPALLQLSGARASSFSGKVGRRIVRRRVRRVASFSGPSRRYVRQRYVRRPVRAYRSQRWRVGSFSGPS